MSEIGKIVKIKKSDFQIQTEIFQEMLQKLYDNNMHKENIRFVALNEDDNKVFRISIDVSDKFEKQ